MLLAEFIQKNEDRFIFKLSEELAPIKYAILPLMKKEGLTEVALDIYNNLKNKYMCSYDDSGSIGKRYVRNDIVGTPYCITVDYQTLEDNSVTIRYRDTTEQKRISIDELY